MMYAQKHATYFIVNHVVFMQCHPVILGPSLKQTVGGLGSMKTPAKRDHVVGTKMLLKAPLIAMSRTLGVSITVSLVAPIFTYKFSTLISIR